MKLDKLLCYMFLFAFLALTLHKKTIEFGFRSVSVEIFNYGVNVKTKDCAGSRPLIPT